MSKRAIISDVHSNLVALEAVLADIKTQNVDAIVCLGDICGYGPQPVECIAKVRQAAIWTLRGNHDEALFYDPRDFGKNARLAIEWQRRILEPKLEATLEEEERWQWLQNLPIKHVENDVLFVHASPRDPVYEYVLREDFDTGCGPSEKAKEIFAAMDWLCFCGHSHRPGVVSEDYKWLRPLELEDSTYVIKKGFKTLVNVGSVGQPRDGITTACYVIFDYSDPADHTKTAKLQPITDAPPEEKTVVSRNVAEEKTVLSRGSTENTLVIRKEDEPPPPDAPASAEAGPEEETRTSEELKKARETVMMGLPRVTFRRVEYDIAEAQARFRAVPELPEANGLRLAKGL